MFPFVIFDVRATSDLRSAAAVFVDHRMNEYELKPDWTSVVLDDFREFTFQKISFSYKTETT